MGGWDQNRSWGDRLRCMYPVGLGCGPVTGCCKYSDELLDCGITFVSYDCLTRFLSKTGFYCTYIHCNYN
jgi:hypothetical protein